MAFVITQPCIDTMDKSCVEVCPVDCIHFEEGADRMLYIDPVECIDCGACQPACPVSAIFPEADVPADQAPFTEINALWYQDRAAARAKIPAGAPAAAEAPAEPAAAATEEAAAPPAIPTGRAEAPPSADGATEQPAAAPKTPADTPAPPRSAPPPEPPPAGMRIRLERPSEYKFGEGGVEGKCALCGQYVTKGGVKFRRKSVLCPECAKKRFPTGNPFAADAGRR